jgi:hypothetical protein
VKSKGGDCQISFCFSKFSACHNDFLKYFSTRILSVVLYLVAQEVPRWVDVYEGIYNNLSNRSAKLASGKSGW